MKTGLVLEGGAIRTIFSAGITDAFIDYNIDCDYVIGCSAGIAFGVSYVSKQPGRNLNIMRKYVNTRKYMGFSNLINPKIKSYFNLNFVYEDIPNILDPIDMDTLVSFKGDCKAVVTNVVTGKAEYLDVERGTNPHNTVLKATCALPLMSPIIKYKGGLYLDGGISDSIPYKKSLEDGCEKLIIVLTREPDYEKGPNSLLSHINIHYREYPEFCEACKNRHIEYNSTLKDIKELERQGKAFVFRPYDTYGVKRNERDMDKILALYNEGYIMAKERMDDLKAYLNS